MKTIRNFTILVGLSLMLFALGAVGARAQGLVTTSLTGTFTLPFDAQWGSMILPAGEYTLNYGQLFTTGTKVVAISGKAKGSPHGWIVARTRELASAAKTQLVCIREGDKGYVSELQMAEIGESASFAVPHGVSVRARVLANNPNPNENTQLAEARIRIQRVPVIPNGM